jgi:hypothetical protein
MAGGASSTPAPGRPAENPNTVHAPMGAATPRLHGCRCVERSASIVIDARRVIPSGCDAADAPRTAPGGEPSTKATAHMHSTIARAIERRRSVRLPM